jgi:mRNA interferase MazF
MTACEQGDVVLVAFAFTDESGDKRRPAVILSTRDYHRNRQEAIIAAIHDRTTVGQDARC